MDESKMVVPDESNVGAALEFARKTAKPRIVSVTPFIGAEEVFIVPKGDGSVELVPSIDLFKAHAPTPERRKGTIVVHDVASFVAQVNRDKRADSVIYADVPNRKLTAILDFDGAGGADPRWRQDRVVYEFQLSPQLQAWLEAGKRPMDQRTFARLIDDRLNEVSDGSDLPEDSIAQQFASRRGFSFPGATDMLVFTRTIVTKSDQGASEEFDENTGSSSLQFTKKNDVKTPDGRPISVPAAILTTIPILCGPGATEYSIAWRLRFDVPEGARIVWKIEPHALERYILAAVEDVLKVVREASDASPAGCGLPVFLGTAPS